MSGGGVDAVVIGAGLVGCAVAMHLAEQGVRVQVLEQGGVACATSGSGMGHVFVVPRPAPLARMTLRSAELWHRFAADCAASGESFFWRPGGVHWLAAEEGGLDPLARIARDLRAIGEDVEELDAAGLLRREPALAKDLAGGLFHSRDAVLYPVHGAAMMLRRARSMGADLCSGVKVERIAMAESAAGAPPRVTGVIVNGALWPADVVVQCSGIHAPGIHVASGLSRLPIHPRRGEVAVTGPGVDLLHSQVLEVGYLDGAQGDDLPDPEVPGDPGSAACYLQPQEGGRCLIGSTRRFPDPDQRFDKRVDRRLLAHSMARAFRFVPALRQAPIVRAWTGLRPFVPDRQPLVGPMPGLQGYYLACGHEGLGLTLSQITGQVIAGMVTATLSPELAADAAGWLPDGRLPVVSADATADIPADADSPDV